MKNIIKYNILLIFSLIFYFQTFGQKIEPEIKLQHDTIIIGVPNELIINLSVDKTIDVVFPNFKDTISKNIEILGEYKPEFIASESIRNIEKKYLITSFDTGLNIIPAISIKLVLDNDSSFIFTSETQFFVKPYVLLDTIPVDTVYADNSGFVVFGKDAFKNEIEQYIPDSIKQSVSIDSLNQIKAIVFEQFLNMFASELTKNSGFYDQEEIRKIAESSSQNLYLFDKSGVLNKYIVAGSVDTVFVQDFQQVKKSQALFTLYRIKDIKENMFNTPFNFAEFWFYFKKYLQKYWWAVIILLLLVIALIYFFKYYKKGLAPNLLRIKQEEPAHVIALKKLEFIRKEKIWAKGEIKEYHVQITDVIREYIEKRFGVFAIEMTTNEILESFDNIDLISEQDYFKLKQILELADNVKFAKYKALQNENDLSLKNSFEFVENTKEIIEENSKITQTEAVIEIEQEENFEQTKDNSYDE
ncbi:MAG: hypothetical protein GX793_05675 [Bacteroidales bacterium]|jgi:hypothetical protein|nr:hypothetical protein [Bacteroidales bacterium]MCK9498696.1 hypothetical protein [Bacteroidales bacterium]MDY0314027.1 hypothetical protein [Bacteroidales bacterium]NLB86531.1 hypothetical protein [Bacteroidales bacterium]